MTLRNALGGNVRGPFDQINALLDSEDALIVLLDGRRMVSYANGFAASPSQLELLGVEIERSARNAVGVPSTTNRGTGGTVAAEQALDEVLAESFPASDPPSWNPGIVRPVPAGHLTRGTAPAEDAEGTLPMADVVAVSRPAHADRTFLQAFASLCGAAGLTLLMGVAILLIGLPIALVVRGLLETVNWLFGVNVR